MTISTNSVQSTRPVTVTSPGYEGQNDEEGAKIKIKIKIKNKLFEIQDNKKMKSSRHAIRPVPNSPGTFEIQTEACYAGFHFVKSAPMWILRGSR